MIEAGLPRGWQEFVPTPRPAGMRKRKQKACFRNAQALAWRIDSPYRYAEGYAWSENLSGWVHHAWLVDADGRAIDPTWKEPGLRYLGRIVSVTESDPEDWGGNVISWHEIYAAYDVLTPEFTAARDALDRERAGHAGTDPQESTTTE